MSHSIIEYESLVVGKELPPFTKPPVTKVQLVKYAGASGDFNPLHTDDEFARSIGMDGVIAHGMLVMGFLGEYVMKLIGLNGELKRFNMRFGAITKPGDEITCRATVANLYEKEGRHYIELELTAEKAPEKIVGSGKASICLFQQ